MAKRLQWISVGACVVTLAIFIALAVKLPGIPEDSAPAIEKFRWPSVEVPQGQVWEVFQRTRSPFPPVAAGPLGKRFRLAGTFFAYGDGSESDGSFCKAILDDLESKEQHLIREGDVLDDVQVLRILRDRVVLRRAGGDEELWLSFTETLPDKSKPAVPTSKQQPREEPVLEVNRFGKRVGETRWVFSRDELMKYYRELLEDPERIAQLYETMRPVYEDGRINGYNVNVQGEADFFKAAGLQEGDIVRKVNSMNMTSRNRAEYFIGEFANNRMSAVVLEIEREGAAKKLVYLIR